MENLKSRAVQLMHETCPDCDLQNKFLGDLPWGSLEWANFISGLVSECPEDHQQRLLRKLFVEHDLQSLTWNEFLTILGADK